MEPTELLAYVAGVLERLGVRYAVVGSVASSYYGEARLTNDVGIIADLHVNSIAALVAAFPKEDFYVSEDAIQQAIRTRGQFNVIHPESGLKVDIVVPPDNKYESNQLQRRIRVRPTEAGFEAYFAAPEDVILKKMEFYREGGSQKHLRDIAGMLKVSAGQIDREFIDTWAAQMGLSGIWQEIVSRVDGVS